MGSSWRQWCVLPFGVVLLSCSVERYPGDEVGIYAHGDLAIGSVTFDQGVAVEVYREGAFVPVSARPTSLIEGRASYVRATWDVPEDWEAREIAAVLEIVQVGGEATSEVRRRWIEGPGDLRYPEGAFDWFVPGELMTPGSSWRVGFYEVEGARIDLLPPPAHVIPRTRGPTGVKIGRHEIELLVVPIDHQFSGPMDCEGPPQFDASRIAELYDYLARINPVDNVVINVRDTPLEWTESAGSLSKILDALSELREADGAPPYVYYYGAIDPCDWGSTAGFAGLARVPDEPTRAYAWKRVAVGDMRRPGHPSNETFVHEIGHTQGRRHVPCKGTEGNPVDDYPVELGKTGSYGFDHFRWALHPPSHADYMSYCDPTWVGAYGWNQVMPVIEKLTNWKEQDGATNDVGDGHTLMISLYPDGTSRWWVRRGPPTRAATMQAAWKTDGGELVHRALTVHQSTGETTHLEVPLDDARQIPRQLTLSAVGGDSDPTVSVGLHGRTLVAPDALLATVPPSRYSTI